MGKSTRKIQKDLIPFWESIGFRIAVGILVPLCISIYALISIAGFYNYFSGSFGEFSERKERIESQWASVRIRELSYRVKLAELKYAVERYVTGDRRQFRPQVDRLVNEFEAEVRQAYVLSGDDRRADSRKVYNTIYGTIRFLREYVDQVERQPASDVRLGEQTRDRLLLLTGDIENTLKRLKARYELFELQDQETVRAEYEEIRDGVMTMTLFVLIFGLVICGVVTFTITNPINKVIGRLRDIAKGEGDLTKRIQTRTIGEMRVVALLMNEFLDSVHEIIFTIRGATESINESVGQVGSQTQATTISAAEINKNMMSQSMNLEDCSMSLTRIDELLQSTSESTRQAASLSRLAMDRALKGGSSVQETVGAMEKIEESARKVEFLISTIQGIATQTNLLAINAAIEASKAGEHGKGFAVVAEEVRKLAERSKGLTVEVTDLITEVNSRVKVGSGLARGAGTALDGIIKDVEAVASLIQRIASASTKQTESSSRLLTAIQTVNQAVRQNLTSLHRVSRGAEVAGVEVDKLDGMIGQLNHIVRLFKLRDLVEGMGGMAFQGNFGVTRIPAEAGAPSLDLIQDTGETGEAPAPEYYEEAQILGDAEAAAPSEEAPLEAPVEAPREVAMEAPIESPAADPAEAPMTIEAPMAVAAPLASQAEAPPAPATVAEEEEFVIDEEGPAVDLAPATPVAAAPKIPGLVAAPPAADQAEDDGDQSFFSADELSRGIKSLPDKKDDEDVA